MASEVVQALTKLSDRLEKIEGVTAGLTRRHTGAVPASGVPTGPPNFRRGSNIMSSRGFSYGKCMAVMGKCLREEEAREEMDLCRRFTKAMQMAGYRQDRADSILIPFWPEALNEQMVDDDLYMEIKSMIHAGTAEADMDEFMWLQKRYDAQRKTATPASPAQSWLDQSVGGAWVGPATFGSPIELLRNMPTLMAVAQTAPLGPTGRLTMPRMTAATQGGWLGENTAQTPSVAGTSSLELVARKAFAIVILPGELLRFGSPAAEAMIRADLFKTCYLIADKGMLDGSGTTTQPQGLVTASLLTGNPLGFATASLTAANTMSPQDPYKFIAAVEAHNGVFSGWVMRPELFWALLETRATTQTGSSTFAQAGQFVYNQFRAMQDGEDKRLNGYKVITSAQVSKTRGTGTQTFVIGGQLEDFLVGLFGAIEMSQTDGGFTLFSSDQVAVRALMSVDGGAQHPGLFCIVDAVNLTPGA